MTHEAFLFVFTSNLLTLLAFWSFGSTASITLPYVVSSGQSICPHCFLLLYLGYALFSIEISSIPIVLKVASLSVSVSSIYPRFCLCHICCQDSSLIWLFTACSFGFSFIALLVISSVPELFHPLRWGSSDGFSFSSFIAPFTKSNPF